MHRFKTKKKESAPAPISSAPPPQKESTGVFSKWGKSTPAPEPTPKLDLAAALPSTDDFRTSLLMPKLADRFSLLQAELAAASANGTPPANSSDNPLVLGNEKRPFGLADIAETASLHGAESVHSAPDNNRLTTFSTNTSHSADDAGGSIMSRARPTEGNVLFGGRQKVYKIPSGRPSEDDRDGLTGGAGTMGGRVYYDDDVPAATFRQRKKEFEDQYENTDRSTMSSNNSSSITRSSTAATSINSRNDRESTPATTLDSGASSPRSGGFSVAAALAKPRRPLYEQAADGQRDVLENDMARSRAASPTGERPAPAGGFGGFNFGFDSESKSGSATPALVEEEREALSPFGAPFGRPVSPLGRVQKERKGSFNEEAFQERLGMRRVELSRAASPPPATRDVEELRRALENVDGEGLGARGTFMESRSGSEYGESLYDGRFSSDVPQPPRSPYADQFARKDSSAFPMDKLPASPGSSVRGAVSPMFDDKAEDSPTLPPSQGLSVLVRQHLRADSKASSIYPASTYSRMSRIERGGLREGVDSVYSVARPSISGPSGGYGGYGGDVGSPSGEGDFEDHLGYMDYASYADRPVSPPSPMSDRDDRRDTLKTAPVNALDGLDFGLAPRKSEDEWRREERDNLNDLPPTQPSPARSASPTSTDWEAELEQRRRMVEENIRSLSGSPVPGEEPTPAISKKGLGLLNEAKLRAQGIKETGKAKKMLGMRSSEDDLPGRGPIPRSVTAPNMGQHPAHRPGVQRGMTMGSPPGPQGHPAFKAKPSRERMRDAYGSPPPASRSGSAMGRGREEGRAPGSRSGSAMGQRGRAEIDDLSSYPGPARGFRSPTPGRERSQHRGVSRQASREGVRPKTNGSQRRGSGEFGRRPGTNYSQHSVGGEFAIQPAPRTRSRGNSTATSPVSPPRRFDFEGLPTPSPALPTPSPGLAPPESVPLPNTPNSVFSNHSDSSALPTPPLQGGLQGGLQGVPKNPKDEAMRKLSAFTVNAARKRAVDKRTIGAPKLISSTNEIEMIGLEEAKVKERGKMLGNMGGLRGRRMTTTTKDVDMGGLGGEVPEIPGKGDGREKGGRLKKSTSDGGGLRQRARDERGVPGVGGMI
ncbi:hypothetical protein BJ508DRAFT_54587 [Ascobolus immersus RN42]|uniref:Uncharacterized protein n=1 Tax=Ascobolus immersus RN42 TaxID=1160509 RepID=A0A3N4HM31_ASCIM|nr:hypothetical protein BJ508DRAFT_54587 [Ascobolus immersus RN42]